MADRSPAPAAAAQGTAAIALAATLWSIAAVVASDLFDDGVPPMHLVQARAVLTALGLAVTTPAAWRRPPGGRGRTGVIIALGLSLAAVNASYYVAIDRLPVAVAIVLQYTAPALIVAWSALRPRRMPGIEILGALAATLTGVVLVSGVTDGNLGALDALGLVMGGVAAVTFAAYTILSERAGRVYGTAGTILRAFSAASVAWIVFQAPQGVPASLFEAANLPRVLYVGLAGTLAPFLLFVWGVQHVRPERASIAATLEPVVAAALAWFVLDQALTVVQIVGGLLVIAAVVVVQAQPSGRVLAPEPGAVTGKSAG